MWRVNGLIPGFSVPCPYKLDSKATREYQRLSGCTDASVPVEMSYAPGSGSNCGHWQEQCFQYEVMTPSASTKLPVSSVTIAGLEDLGYEVNYDEAEPFDAAHMNATCLCNSNHTSNPSLRRRSLVRTNQQEVELGDGVPTPSSSSSSSYRRELSEEGRAAAMSYGKDVLAARRDTMSITPLPDTIGNIGEDLVFVMFEENETVHSVLVIFSDDA